MTPPAGTAQAYTSNAYGQTATAPGGLSYAYDALGWLATRTTGSGTADFAYSGSGDTLASDGTTSYTYDPSGDVVAEQHSGGTAGAVLADVHGDVTGAFAPASSTSSLAASAAYSPYGSVTATTGSMPSLGYQGQYTDPATGDTDMSARWYAPSTGTFTSSDITTTGMPDPSIISGTPYGYVNGNPLSNTDLTGHCLVCSIFDEIVHPASEYFDVRDPRGGKHLPRGTVHIPALLNADRKRRLPQLGVLPYEGGSPAPTYLPTINPYVPSRSGGGGGGGGGGGAVAVMAAAGTAVSSGSGLVPSRSLRGRTVAVRSPAPAASAPAAPGLLCRRRMHPAQPAALAGEGHLPAGQADGDNQSERHPGQSRHHRGAAE